MSTAPSGGRLVRIIGPGRAGGAIAIALAGVGWRVAGLLGRGDDPSEAADGVDLVVIATPDAQVAGVSSAIRPRSGTVVAHLAGSLGIDVLATHDRVAGIHPLVALPSAEIGAERIRSGVWFGIAGDRLATEIVDELGGRPLVISDEHRSLYHAAACVASNHLVGLLDHVGRLAEPTGVPLDAYLDLVRATIDNVAALGPAVALTGPVARGDWQTVEAHRAAIDRAVPTERSAYEAMVELTARLAAGTADLDESASE